MMFVCLILIKITYLLTFPSSDSRPTLSGVSRRGINRHAEIVLPVLMSYRQFHAFISLRKRYEILIKQWRIFSLNPAILYTDSVPLTYAKTLK